MWSFVALLACVGSVAQACAKHLWNVCFGPHSGSRFLKLIEHPALFVLHQRWLLRSLRNAKFDQTSPYLHPLNWHIAVTHCHSLYSFCPQTKLSNQYLKLCIFGTPTLCLRGNSKNKRKHGHTNQTQNHRQVVQTPNQLHLGPTTTSSRTGY